MPELSLDTIRGKKPITIDGEARDITNQPDIDDETLDLASEPEFQTETAEDRFEAGASRLDNLITTMLAGSARALAGKEIHTKVDVLKYLTAALHLNEFGLPDYVYRADLLDAREISELLAPTTANTLSPPSAETSGIQAVNAQIENAKVPLQYYEGYPALESGMAFWQQLDWEPREAYDAFVFYLELDGVRRLNSLIAYPMGDLQTWFHTYYWDMRVKAFDLYRVADAQRTKLRRMVSTEDKHFRLATKLFDSLALAVDDPDFADKLTKMEPDKLIKVLDSVVKIQRISAGLPAQGGTIPENKPAAQTTTVNIMQQITQGDVVHTEAEQVDVLSENPDMLDKMQDMLLEVQQKRGFNE